MAPSVSGSELNWRDGVAFLLAQNFNPAISDAEGKVVLDTGHYPHILDGFTCMNSTRDSSISLASPCAG